jgi:hypothetical protein
MTSPSVLVSCLNLNEILNQGGQANGGARFVAYVITAGTSSIVRDGAALDMVEALAPMIVNNAWNYVDGSTPKNIRADNLYSGPVDKLGVAIWAVSWVQKTDLAIFDTSSLDNFESLYSYQDQVIANGVDDIEGIQELYHNAVGVLAMRSPAVTELDGTATYVGIEGRTEFYELLAYLMDSPGYSILRYTGTTSASCDMFGEGSIKVDTNASVTIALVKYSEDSGAYVATVLDTMVVNATAGATHGFRVSADATALAYDANYPGYITIEAKASVACELTVQKLTLSAKAV